MDSRVFPNDEIFRGLRSCAERFPGIAVNDPANGVSTSYDQLIRNLVATRKSIQDALPASLFDGRGRLLDNSIWVGLLSPLSEDFIVGCLAILSIGGAIMPMASGILPEEANHFLEQTEASLLLVTSGQYEAAAKIHQHRQLRAAVPRRHLHVVTITCGHRDHCMDTAAHLQIDDTLSLPSNRPGLIVFTSGTTGPPKGAVLPRQCLYPSELCTPDNRRVNLSDRVPHWLGGMVCTLLPLLTGHMIEIMKPGSPAEDYWELLKQQRVTKVAWGPMTLSKLKQYYDDHLNSLPSTELEPYLSGIRAIREIRLGSAMPTATLLEFWDRLMDVPLQMGYAATEAGGLISMLPNVNPTRTSIGRPLPDVEMKLSEGTAGEVLIKGPRIMLHYLNDEKATRAAFDDEGFFRTGDLAHMEGNEFVFEGRASSDFIQVYAYRVPVLPVENALTSIPYVAEAVVVAVPDGGIANQLGALVRPRPGAGQVLLHRLHSDLARSLPAYTFPTKLRVLQEEEILPRTATGKVNKKQAVARYFLGSAAGAVETCQMSKNGKEGPQKAWDWAGLQ